MKPCHSSPFRSHVSLSTALAVAVFSHFAAPSAFAVTYYWDNNGATAGFGTALGSWANPTIGDATQGFSESTTGAVMPVNVTTTTADTINFGNGTTGLATGSIDVSGTVEVGTVNFASGSGPITLSGGTISLGVSRTITAQNDGNTIGSAIALGGNSTISFSRNVSSPGILTLNGEISGSGNLAFTTPNVGSGGNAQLIILGAANAWSGTTTITTGNSANTTTIRAGVNDALPTSTVLTLSGGSGTGSGRTVTFDLNGKNQTLAGLSNSISTLTARNQRVSSTAAATLTINNSSNYSFGGAGVSSSFNGSPVNPTAQITGAISIVKSAAGTFTLLGSQNYTGITTISGGKLVGVVGGHHQTSDVTLNNSAATYGVSITDSTKSWTCKSLATTAAGTLEFNFGAIAPSTSVSPLIVTNAANFSAATPLVNVVVSTNLAPGTYPLMTWGSTSGTAPTTADLTVSQLPFGGSAELQVSGNTLNLVINSSLTYAVKANNTDNLNLSSSWVGGTLPGVTALATWNSTVTSANSTVLGADLTWPGVVIENPNGLVTIGAGHTLTLGAADTDIDMSTTPVTSADFTLNCPLTLGAANVWNVAATRTLTLGGPVSGAFDVTKLGAGTLRLGASNVLPDGVGSGNLSLTGTLDLNGKNETLNGLSGAGMIDNFAAATISTLTVGANDQTSSFSGILKNSTGTLSLVKTGTGTQIVSGANTLSGTVTINGGTLGFGSLASVSGITIGGGASLRPDVSNAAINAPITLGAAMTTSTIHAPNAASSGTTTIPFDLEGSISGAGNLTLSGISSNNAYGTINLKAASNYTGSTLMTCSNELAAPATLGNQNIFVRLFVDNALPVSTVLTLDGGDGAPLATAPGRFCEFNLSGRNQTLGGLTNVAGRTLRVQRVVNNSLTSATLTVNNGADHTYSGQLGWVSGFGSAVYNNFNLAKSGSGTQTFSGPLRYNGATTVTSGTLSLSSNNGNNDLSTVTIATGATLDLSFTGSDTVDKLIIGNTQKMAGVYGRLGSGAQFPIPQITGDGTLTVSSSPPEGGFSLWIAGPGFANGPVPEEQRGANDDFDKDGISNLVEFAIDGQDPTVSNASIGSFTAGTLSFTKRAGTVGLTYAIQDSTDLGISDAWAPVTGTPPDYVNDATTISYKLTPGTPAKNFLRLQVLSN